MNLITTNSVRLLVVLAALHLAACAKPAATSSASTTDAASVTPSRYLYVSSGVCYSGNGNTTFSNTTSSNIVYRINVDTGARDSVIADYNASPSSVGDSPVTVVDWDSTHVGVLVENSTTASLRRIEVVEKKLNGSRTTFTANTTALSAQLRGMVKLSDGSVLVSKGTAIEKITSSNVRLLKGANPWVNAPTGGTCGTTNTTLIPALTALPTTGKILMTHSAASNARALMISNAGYSTSADCLAAMTAPGANGWPVATAYDSVSKTLFVAYGGNALTDNLNAIYAYTVDETANTITGATEIYDSFEYGTTYPYLLYGISSMYYDESSKSLFVGTAINNSTTVANYAIEKLSFDSTKLAADRTHALSRSGALPFYSYGYDTKCVSSMMIAQ